MPYRPLKGRPDPEEIAEAIRWLQKNDVDDDSGRACGKVAVLLQSIRKKDLKRIEESITLDTIRSSGIGAILGTLDSEGKLG